MESIQCTNELQNVPKSLCSFFKLYENFSLHLRMCMSCRFIQCANNNVDANPVYLSCADELGFGIANGRVLNLELHARRNQKVTLLHLFTNIPVTQLCKWMQKSELLIPMRIFELISFSQTLWFIVWWLSVSQLSNSLCQSLVGGLSCANGSAKILTLKVLNFWTFT